MMPFRLGLAAVLSLMAGQSYGDDGTSTAEQETAVLDRPAVVELVDARTNASDPSAVRLTVVPENWPKHEKLIAKVYSLPASGKAEDGKPDLAHATFLNTLSFFAPLKDGQAQDFFVVSPESVRGDASMKGLDIVVELLPLDGVGGDPTARLTVTGAKLEN